MTECQEDGSPMVWIGSGAPQGGRSRQTSYYIGTDVIQSVVVVRDLGVYFDSHLTMKARVVRVARTCFYHLRRLRSIRRVWDVTSLQDLFPPSWSRGWITATRYLRMYRLQRWHRSRESSMLLFGWSWIWDHVITWHRRYIRASLVANCRENQVQTLSLGPPFDQWPSTVIFDRVGHFYGQRPRSRFSPFSREAWSGHPAIKSGFVRAGVFRCGTKSFEQSARRH